MRRFYVTHKGAARSFPAYIAVSPHIYCNSPSYYYYEDALTIASDSACYKNVSSKHTARNMIN